LALLVGITYAARSSSNTRGGLAVAIKMQIRRGTATAWATADPTLVAGELGFVTDAGKTAFKIGNGSTPWTSLAYVNSTYTEFPVDAGNNLDTAIVQGRYPLLSGVTYTNVPPAADFNGTTTDGSSILLVTVPSSTIVIQELTTSLTPCKRFIRARATTSAWTAWKRLDTLSATESLSITNLTLSGSLTVGTTSGVLTIPAGVVGTPSLTFSGDTNTGVYSTGADNLSVTTNGVQRVAVENALTTVTTPLTVSGLVTASNALTVTAGAVTLPAGSVAGAALADNGVTVGKLAQIATLTVLGNSTGATANVTALTAGISGTAKTALGLSGTAYGNAVYTGALAALTGVALANTSPPVIALTITANQNDVEYWYRFTSTSTAVGGPRTATITIAVPSTHSLKVKIEDIYGAVGTATWASSPAATSTFAPPSSTVTISITNSSLAGITAFWFSIAKVVIG